MNTVKLDKRLYFEPHYSRSNKQILWRFVTCGYIGMYRWEIRTNGIWPVMYIKLPNNHPLRNISDGDYLESFIQGPNNITYWDGETVGWDFGHFTDYHHGDNSSEDKTMHTVTELKKELKAIIKQCQEIENNPEIIEEIENTVEEIRFKKEKKRFQYDDDDEYYEYEGIYNESKNYSKMSKKNTIRLTESDLKRVISESVKKILNESTPLHSFKVRKEDRHVGDAVFAIEEAMTQISYLWDRDYHDNAAAHEVIENAKALLSNAYTEIEKLHDMVVEHY